MTEKRPLVSVLITVYNEEENFQECIDSLLNQTFQDFEVLILDDGSTDGTAAILEAAAEKDERLRIFYMGRVANRPKLLNQAVEWSQGQYVAIQDADDVALPLRLERQVEILQRNPNVGVVGSACVVIDRETGAERRIRHTAATDQEIRARIFKDIPFAHSTMMIRRDLVLSLGGYDEQYSYPHDYDLIFRIAEVAELASIPDVLLISRSAGYFASSVSVRKRMNEVRRCRQSHWRSQGSVSDLPGIFLSSTVPLAKYAVRQVLKPSPQ